MPESSASIPETETRQPVDLLKAYKLRVQHGLTYQQIADATGQPKSSIHRALTDLMTLLDDPERLQHYEDARPKLFTAVEERLMQSLVDEEVIEKASLRDRAVTFGIVHDKRRLEDGKSTSNLAVLGKLIVDAEARLGGTASQPIDKPESRTPTSGA